MQETPRDSTHWSTRSLAQETEVSASSAGRIWRKNKLQPHRVKTFKLSKDRLFAEKTADIVELYLNPPPGSVVWSADEQCQLQALMRTQPGLPCAPGHCATETPDYKRNGTTTLFAAQNVGSGKVVYMFNQVHTNQEWIQFLTVIEEHSPPDKQIHLIIDNYSAHKHGNVRQWLDERPRIQIHYTPTSGSWLNQVERLFGEVNRKCLKHRSVATVEALQQEIAQFLDRRNENPKPIHWKATTDEILQEGEARVAIFARSLRSPETHRRPGQYRTLFQSSKPRPRDLTELEAVFSSLPKDFQNPASAPRARPFREGDHFIDQPHALTPTRSD